MQSTCCKVYVALRHSSCRWPFQGCLSRIAMSRFAWQLLLCHKAFCHAVCLLHCAWVPEGQIRWRRPWGHVAHGQHATRRPRVARLVQHLQTMCTATGGKWPVAHSFGGHLHAAAQAHLVCCHRMMAVVAQAAALSCRPQLPTHRVQPCCISPQPSPSGWPPPSLVLFVQRQWKKAQ